MKTLKYLPLGLVAGAAFSLASCDDTLDCGCECNVPKVTSFEFLNESTMKEINNQKKEHVHTAERDSFDKGKVASGTTVIVYGENLAEVTSIMYGDKAATLYPTLISDNQIIFKVPEGITKSATPKFCTKACPTGVKGLPKVYLGKPCVAMCDNEFAISTLKVKGNSLVDGLEAWFWSDVTNDYTVQSPSVSVGEGGADATITVPKGFGNNHPILFKTGAGESFSSFIFHDVRGMMIDRDDETRNACLQNIADWNFDENNTDLDPAEVRDKLEYTKQDLVKQYFTSDNSIGDFTIFYSAVDGGYAQLFYNLTYGVDKNGLDPADLPNTVFGKKTLDGLYGDDATWGDMSKYCVKFEAFVSDEYGPMNGGVLALGFREGSASFPTKEGFDVRDYCAAFQPATLTLDKPATGDWKIKSADPWNTHGDWMTICIPMDEFKYDYLSGAYSTSIENNRMVTDGSDIQYKYFGDKDNGQPYYMTHKVTTHESDPCTALDEYIEEVPYNSFAIVYNNYDNAISNAQEDGFAIAIDNVRIGLADDNNGSIYRMLDFGAPTRDYYEKPITSCK